MSLSGFALRHRADPIGRRTHTAPTRTVVSLNLLRPGLVPHPLCQRLPHFLCISGCCGRGQLALGLAFAENSGSVLVSFCVFWGTQHDYTQMTDCDRLQGHSPACPPKLGTLWQAEQSRCLHTSPSQLLLYSSVRPRPGWLPLPPLSRDLSSSRHCWLAAPGAR